MQAILIIESQRKKYDGSERVREGGREGERTLKFGREFTIWFHKPLLNQNDKFNYEDDEHNTAPVST